MKNFVIFVSGCVVGAFGAMVYLHKDMQKKVAQMASTRVSEDSVRAVGDDEDDLPFVMGENAQKVIIPDEKQNHPNTSKTRYDALVRDVAEMENERNDDPTGDDQKAEAFYEEVSKRPQFEPIHDIHDFNDSDYETEEYVYYRGDNIFCTNMGTIVERPAVLVGTGWEQWVGAVKPNTALIRDNKRLVNIDILVENGLYSDEYGDFINTGEE